MDSMPTMLFLLLYSIFGCGKAFPIIAAATSPRLDTIIVAVAIFGSANINTRSVIPRNILFP